MEICEYDKMLVAVSGGADSVALLHMLVEAGKQCRAVHCNFHLRGEEADRDEAHVRRLCEKLGVALHVEHFDTRAYAAEHKVSIEMAARELRYDLFEKLLDQYDLPVVAVAHHADDAVETFMLNISRGTGIKGLTGMKQIQGRVVRPLLGMSRRDIEKYCDERHIEYCTDSTNLEDEYTRNKIRHNIVPVFKEINPSFLRSMRGTMEHLAQVYGVFAREIEKFKQRAMAEDGGETKINIQQILELGEDAEVYLFEVLNPEGFTADSVRKICKTLRSGDACGKIWYGATKRAIIDRECIILAQSDVSFASYTVEKEGEVDVPFKMEVKKKEVDSSFILSRESTKIHLDADKVKFPLTIRRWKEGDRFKPLGMKGWKKVSDFFVDQKMGLREKEECWIMESGGEIIWIVGRRVDDRVKWTKETKRVLEIEIEI